MALLRDPTPSCDGRFDLPLLSGGLMAAVLILLGAACEGEGAGVPSAPPSARPDGQGASMSTPVTVYSTPT